MLVADYHAQELNMRVSTSIGLRYFAQQIWREIGKLDYLNLTGHLFN